jgi:protein ImuB
MLMHLAHEHSSRVEVHGQDLVVMDVGGLRHLWGSPREVGERLRRVAAERDLGIRVAVAGTKMAALLATQGRCGLTVIPSHAEAEALSTLPISIIKQLSKAQTSILSRPIQTHQSDTESARVSAVSSSCVVSVLMLLPVVQRWGIRTLGELAALPANELFSRLGHGGLELQRIARGEDSRPFVPEPTAERFEETVTLEWPIEGLEPLSIVLSRVLDPLCAHLDIRGVAAGMLQVRLMLVSRETHERTLRFQAAISDPNVLRTLILLDLDAHPPSAGIDRVTVVADPVPARTLQFSLLERAVPSAESLSTLLARLTVLMGDQRCGSPVLVDTHQPGVFEMHPFAPKAHPPLHKQPRRGKCLVPVLRRFRHPISARVTVEHGHPVRVSTPHPHSADGRVVTCAGPWRSSGHWWMPSHSLWDHDEWDVELSDGGVYRMFRDRVSKRWFVEGLMD